ncbi:MAG TPA: BTAD domain-containing putative transcriptional regulator [Gemmatimonadaceae bacterium]|nr:BTAD domain-containing putative transcriptional regulator [Gemmatimonadaceae bacterium]
MVELRTFGGLSLVGKSLPPASTQRRRLALLVLLSRGGDRGVSRDRLLAYLWPESPAERARHALDQLLYATRRDLGRRAIASAAGQLRLVPEVVRADCQEFESALEASELERAVQLYAGPFLDGVHLGESVELERWVEAERSRLEGRFLDALERLARDAAGRRDARTAVAWWRRRAAAETLDSLVARCLVEALVEAGDFTGARRHAHDHIRLLREELDTEPDAAFTTLARRLAHEPAVVITAGDALPTGERTREAPSGIDAGQSDLTSGSTATVVSRALPAALGPPLPDDDRRRFVGRRRIRAGALAGVSLALVAFTMATRSFGAGSAASPDVVGEAHYAPAVRAPDTAARSLYLRGRVEWNRRSREGLEAAVVLFRRATELNPAYPEGHAGLADAYVILGYLGYVPGDAAFPKGKAAALQALSLDPSLGEAHAALGKALQWERRWVEAEKAFRRAIELSPEYATGHQWYALLLTILARREEALVFGRRAAELDPLSIQIQNTHGIMLYNVGELDSALHVYERLVTYEPDTAWVRQNPWVLSNFGKVAAAAGRHRAAIQLIERAAGIVPQHPRPLYELAMAHLAAGDRSRALAAFDRADPGHPHYPVYRAMLHGQLGELDAAFELLERVAEWGPVQLLTLETNRSLQELRADPRYAFLRRRLGLPG